MKKIITSPIFWILISVGLFFLVRWLMNRKKDVKLDFSVGQGFANLLSTVENRYASRGTEKGAGIYLDVPVTTKATNNTERPINLNNLRGNLSFEGETILQTKSDSTALNNIQAGAKSTSQPVTDMFQVLINKGTIKFLKEFITGKKPKMKYDFRAKIQGKDYQFTDSTIINQTQQQ